MPVIQLQRRALPKGSALRRGNEGLNAGNLASWRRLWSARTSDSGVFRSVHRPAHCPRWALQRLPGGMAYAYPHAPGHPVFLRRNSSLTHADDVVQCGWCGPLVIYFGDIQSFIVIIYYHRKLVSKHFKIAGRQRTARKVDVKKSRRVI